MQKNSWNSISSILLVKILGNFKLFFFFKVLFIYPWETQRERQRYRQREKQAPYREPVVRLNPRTLGSWPELKADAQPLSHPGALALLIFKFWFEFLLIGDAFLSSPHSNNCCCFMFGLSTHLYNPTGVSRHWFCDLCYRQNPFWY